MKEDSEQNPSQTAGHKRRPRYAGKYPRKFSEKYKEHRGDRETLEKVLASGKTPAGSHRSILVREVIEFLQPAPGQLVVDCTCGRGGHTRELLRAVQPGGFVLALDVDAKELEATRAQLASEGFGPEMLRTVHSNYAGIGKALGALGRGEADCVLADLGVSSMQLDDPGRGFSFKAEGPLDMRMNRERGIPASAFLHRIAPAELAGILQENADEPEAGPLATLLAGREFPTTTALASEVRRFVLGAKHRDPETAAQDTVRRVFQAIRIAVNEEFTALDAFLRTLPFCLKAGGRVAILTFHSGEDRRVKQAFKTGLKEGTYSEVVRDVIRPTPQEQHENPRSRPAKMRWAIRA